MNSSAQKPAEARERLLLVDDTPANLDLLSRTLEPVGYEIVVATSGESALRVAERSKPDLILLDVMMEGMDGFTTCRRLKAMEATREIPVVFISARSRSDTLIDGFSAGGIDFISKPFDQDEVLVRVDTHLKIARLTRELKMRNTVLEATIAKLREETGRREKAEKNLQVADEKLSLLSARDAEQWGLSAFVGCSAGVGKILRDIRRLQNFPSINVLIQGESGTGKELVARALHFGSNRSTGSFVPVNCVAIPTELAESMLFGHVRGAFTGATMDRKGYFELANGGTLFLDEIGDMPPVLQAKLLRVIEDGCITPVGSTKSKIVDVRLVSATNVDLQSRFNAGGFRQDLYFRLAGFVVQIPALRERREDLALLATHFIEVFAKEMGLAAPALSNSALHVLEQHAFPGNVRELKNIIERSLIESGGAEILPEHLHLIPRQTVMREVPAEKSANSETVSDRDVPLNLEEAEGVLIRRALASTNGNVAEAARKLGVNRTRIYRRLGEQSPS